MEQWPTPIVDAIPALCDALSNFLGAIKASAQEEGLFRRQEELEEREAVERANRPTQTADLRFRDRRQLCRKTPLLDKCLETGCAEDPVYLGRCEQHCPEGGKHYCNSCFQLTTQHRIPPVNHVQASRAALAQALRNLKTPDSTVA